MKPTDHEAGRVFFGGARRQMPHLTNYTSLIRRAPARGGRRCQGGQWSMDYHAGAAGEFSLDGRHWLAREARTAHLYAAGRAYWERCSQSDVPFPETYLLFTIEDAADLDRLMTDGFARFLDPEGRLAAAMARLADSETPRPWRGQAALYDLMDLLLASHPLAGADRLIATHARAPASSLAQRVEVYLRANYHRPLSLTTLSRAAGVSVSSLTHRYRMETGQSPIARLIEYRLDVARGMLLKGASLKVIAGQTGFYDEFHLSKAFRKRFGTPPRRYARMTGPKG